jgi:hypothetical protein
MIKKGVILFLGLALLFPATFARGADSTIFTLWPLVDYRSSSAVHYSSLHLLGPIIKYETKNDEHEFALRPLYYHAWEKNRNTAYSEFLYPVASKKSEPGLSFFQGLHLLSFDFGKREKGSRNEFRLFPILFYGKSKDKGTYFAFFPLGGKIYDIFGIDEFRFALFPLYGQVRKKDTTHTYWLWPIFSTTRGDRESGFRVWPLFGHSRKEGVYRKRFYLWPIFFSDDLRLNTNNPEHLRAVFPFYVDRESPQLSSHTYLWPFFSHVVNRRKDFEQWDFPWPLWRISRGRDRTVNRFLPFFSDEKVGDTRKRWFLWPLYKIQEIHSDSFDRRRDRLLFFLYSDVRETVHDNGSYSKRRIAFWPLFTYQSHQGVSRFSTLSLLEPFYPENQGIERNWAPLWRLYQCKWDRKGDEVSSFLWNLYWKERRGKDLAMEIFPLFFYKREQDRVVDWELLKGLFHYHVGKKGAEIRLFYLPWGISWGRTAARSKG